MPPDILSVGFSASLIITVTFLGSSVNIGGRFFELDSKWSMILLLFSLEICTRDKTCHNTEEYTRNANIDEKMSCVILLRILNSIKLILRI